MFQEKFENTKGKQKIRCLKLKDRLHWPDERQTMIHKTLHRKLKTEQHHSHKNVGTLIRCDRNVRSSCSTSGTCHVKPQEHHVGYQYTYIIGTNSISKICTLYSYKLNIFFTFFATRMLAQLYARVMCYTRYGQHFTHIWTKHLIWHWHNYEGRQLI